MIPDEAAEAREVLRVYDGETKVTVEDVIRNPAMKSREGELGHDERSSCRMAGSSRRKYNCG